MSEQPATSNDKRQTTNDERTGGVDITGSTVTARDIAGRDIVHIYQAPEPITSLHAIPDPVADFTGRQAELAQLIEALQPGLAAAISGKPGWAAAICGMGGAGKTQLARLVAARLRDAFPEAQIAVVSSQ